VATCAARAHAPDDVISFCKASDHSLRPIKNLTCAVRRDFMSLVCIAKKICVRVCVSTVCLCACASVCVRAYHGARVAVCVCLGGGGGPHGVMGGFVCVRGVQSVGFEGNFFLKLLVFD